MKHSGQTVLWELWAALCLCTALVLPPGSPWLHEPALLYPGLSLAAACCLSGKGGAFRRERKQIKANLIVQLIVQCSGISSEKATKVAKKS